MTLLSEHYYGGVGIKRPVLCAPGVRKVRFALDGADGDVEVTYDPLSLIKKGGAQWLTHLGGSAGELEGVTGVRAVIRNSDGWAKLTLVEMKEEATDGQ